MIEINLLSSGEPRRAAARRAPTVRAPKMPAFAGDPWMAGLAAAGLLVLLWTAFSFWRTGERQAELHAQIEQEVADSTRMATTIQLVETLRARQDTITQRIEVIRDVDRRRYVWPHLMDEISKAVPAFTWLGALSSSDSGDPAAPGPAITLQGNAGSTQALTRFMKNLEGSPFIRDVTLVTSSQVDEAGRVFQRFTLEAKYETPDSALIETVPIVVE